MNRPTSIRSSTPPADSAHQRRRVLLADLLLAIIVLLVYLPSLSSQFVRLDDYQYVVDNPLVRDPTWEGAKRVITEVWKPSTVEGYYQPLTMLSLMLDGHLSAHFAETLDTSGAPDPFIFHLTNVLLHAFIAILVLHFMRALGAGTMTAFLLAALFALHPVAVESVAWVSQRKTLLATPLALGCLLCYLHHGRTGRRGPLAASAALFALAALAKPTVLPLLLVFPLLDVWPLGRRLGRPLATKLPFVVIAAVLGYAAWQSQSASGAALAIPGTNRVEQLARHVALACHSLASYGLALVRPMDLSPYRSIPADLRFDAPPVALSIAAILVIGEIVFLLRRRARYLPVCLLAFVALLLPFLGAVRFDAGVVADRFLYLPMVFPLAVVAGWSGTRTSARAPLTRLRLAQIVLLVFVVAAGFLNHRQQAIWRDSKSLWTHVADICPKLPKAHYEVAVAALDERELRSAVEHAEKAVDLEPSNIRYRLALTQVYLSAPLPHDALAAAESLLGLGVAGSDLGWSHLYAAEAQMMLGRIEAAEKALRAALEQGLSPVTCHSRLGEAALRVARLPSDAVRHYQLAVDHRCDDPLLRWNLGTALHSAGRFTDALREYDLVRQQYTAHGLQLSSDMVAAIAAVRRAIAAASSTQPASQGVTP